MRNSHDNFPRWLAPGQVRVLTLKDDEALNNYAKPIVNERRANQGSVRLHHGSPQARSRWERWWILWRKSESRGLNTHEGSKSEELFVSRFKACSVVPIAAVGYGCGVAGKRNAFPPRR